MPSFATVAQALQDMRSVKQLRELDATCAHIAALPDLPSKETCMAV